MKQNSCKLQHFHDHNAKHSSEQNIVDIKKFQTIAFKDNAVIEAAVSQMKIPKKGSFNRQYEQLLHEAIEEKVGLSVLICSIEHFQLLADKSSLQDAILVILQVALALQSESNKYNRYFSHYGDDKFAILVKGDSEMVKCMTDKFYHAVQAANISFPANNECKGTTIGIHISSTSLDLQKNEIFKTKRTVLKENDLPSHSTNVGNVHEVRNNIKGQSVLALILKKESQVSDFKCFMSECEISDRTDFNLYFITTWQKLAEEEELLSMCICELDFYDEYSEKYNQTVANDILLTVACLLKLQCDAFGAFLAHLENGRFAVVLAGHNVTKGFKVAKSIEASLREFHANLEHYPLHRPLTMSIGLSSVFPSMMNTMSTLLCKVDNALITAQKNGGDQIAVEA